MTKTVAPKREIGKPARSTSIAPANWKFPLEKNNFIIIGVGILFIIVGYLLMGTGVSEEPALLDNAKWNSPVAIVIAPIMLMLGYCVIIPFGILKRFARKEADQQGS